MQAYLSDAAPKHHLFLLKFAVAACPPPAIGYNMNNIFSAQRYEKPLIAVDMLINSGRSKGVQSNKTSPTVQQSADAAAGQSLLLIVTAKTVHAQRVRTYMSSLTPAAMKHAALGTSVQAPP